MKYKSSGKQQQGYTPIPDQPKDKESRPLSGTSIYKIRPSFTLLPQLRNEEKEFFDLVRSGDEYSVLEFLKRSPDFNVNCQDYESNSPLHIAVYNEDVEMVELLLARGVQVMDCHLHAIKLGNTAIFSLLLDKIAENDPTLEFQGYLNSAEFSSGMTPLILAAQHEHYDIIKLLLDRGHKISPPHRPDCLCKKQCRYSKKKESLTNSLRRINTFRALASSAYISQCSYDPILTAFQLSHELQQCAEIEKEFTLEYLSLADRLQHFSVSLLDLCRTTDEVKLVLRQTADGTTSASKFPRLTFAIDTKQKDFLAHPNCQQVLYANWMGEWGDWKAMSFARKTLRVVPQVMLMPVFTFLFWVAPKSKLVRWWQSPISKFINSTVMYIVFLLLLFAETQLYKNFHTRGPPNTGFEWPIMIWVMGFLWEDSKHLYRVGFRKYFGDWWNCYNMTMTLSFIINFAAWLWSYLDVKWWGNKYLERKYWHAHDATLIGEGMFALSTVQAFSRLQYIFQINQHLGPQQISLSHMIQDILKFLSLFFLVMISFTTGLNRLYTYYSGMVRIDQTGLKKIQLGSFTSYVPYVHKYSCNLQHFT
ncbi:PREDICTED: short transient receptor potential channel 4-like [Priapulus caudatus]|uniref:Short transient receptor potential channel 4-like n=1 Tax=Priapulus caudatus TaxID=37621 RepID=A0ABM1EDQ1_PRICU|nr:PREDICTED: short transient receptor potential channel 4-like [Priapulus caudatus]